MKIIRFLNPERPKDMENGNDSNNQSDQEDPASSPEGKLQTPEPPTEMPLKAEGTRNGATVRNGTLVTSNHTLPSSGSNHSDGAWSPVETGQTDSQDEVAKPSVVDDECKESKFDESEKKGILNVSQTDSEDLDEENEKLAPLLSSRDSSNDFQAELNDQSGHDREAQQAIYRGLNGEPVPLDAKEWISNNIRDSLTEEDSEQDENLSTPELSRKVSFRLDKEAEPGVPMRRLMRDSSDSMHTSQSSLDSRDFEFRNTRRLSDLELEGRLSRRPSDQDFLARRPSDIGLATKGSEEPFDLSRLPDLNSLPPEESPVVDHERIFDEFKDVKASFHRLMRRTSLTGTQNEEGTAGNDQGNEISFLELGDLKELKSSFKRFLSITSSTVQSASVVAAPIIADAGSVIADSASEIATEYRNEMKRRAERGANLGLMEDSQWGDFADRLQKTKDSMSKNDPEEGKAKLSTKDTSASAPDLQVNKDGDATVGEPSEFAVDPVLKAAALGATTRKTRAREKPVDNVWKTSLERLAASANNMDLPSVVEAANKLPIVTQAALNRFQNEEEEIRLADASPAGGDVLERSQQSLVSPLQPSASNGMYSADSPTRFASIGKAKKESLRNTFDNGQHADLGHHSADTPLSLDFSQRRVVEDSIVSPHARNHLTSQVWDTQSADPLRSLFAFVQRKFVDQESVNRTDSKAFDFKNSVFAHERRQESSSSLSSEGSNVNNPTSDSSSDSESTSDSSSVSSFNVSIKRASSWDFMDETPMVTSRTNYGKEPRFVMLSGSSEKSSLLQSPLELSSTRGDSVDGFRRRSIDDSAHSDLIGSLRGASVHSQSSDFGMSSAASQGSAASRGRAGMASRRSSVAEKRWRQSSRRANNTGDLAGSLRLIRTDDLSLGDMGDDNDLQSPFVGSTSGLQFMQTAVPEHGDEIFQIGTKLPEDSGLDGSYRSPGFNSGSKSAMFQGSFSGSRRGVASAASRRRATRRLKSNKRTPLRSPGDDAVDKIPSSESLASDDLLFGVKATDGSFNDSVTGPSLTGTSLSAPTRPDTDEIPNVILPELEGEELLEEALLTYSSVGESELLGRTPVFEMNTPLNFLASVGWRQIVANWKHSMLARTLAERPCTFHYFHDSASDLAALENETDSVSTAFKPSVEPLDIKGGLKLDEKIQKGASNLNGVFPHLADGELPTLSSFCLELGTPVWKSPNENESQPLVHHFLPPPKEKVDVKGLVEENMKHLRQFAELIAEIVEFATHNHSMKDEVETHVSYSIDVKSREAIALKAERKYSGDILQVKDVLRAQITFSDDAALLCGLLFLNRISRARIERKDSELDGLEVEIVRVKNLFQMSPSGYLIPSELPTGYRHILVNIRLNHSTIAEIQFQLEEVFHILADDGYALHRLITDVQVACEESFSRDKNPETSDADESKAGAPSQKESGETIVKDVEVEPEKSDGTQGDSAASTHATPVVSSDTEAVWPHNVSTDDDSMNGDELVMDPIQSLRKEARSYSQKEILDALKACGVMIASNCPRDIPSFYCLHLLSRYSGEFCEGDSQIWENGRGFIIPHEYWCLFQNSGVQTLPLFQSKESSSSSVNDEDIDILETTKENVGHDNVNTVDPKATSRSEAKPTRISFSSLGGLGGLFGTSDKGEKGKENLKKSNGSSAGINDATASGKDVPSSSADMDPTLLLSRECLLRCLVLANQGTSVGMTGWLEYGAEHPFGRIGYTPFKILSDMACTLAASGNWNCAIDVLSALVTRSEQHLPLYHPLTLSAMLDLAGAASMVSKVELHKRMLERVSERLSFYLREQECSFFAALAQTKANKGVVFNVQSRLENGMDEVAMLISFADEFQSVMSRDFLRMLGKDCDTALMNECLLADTLSVIANCLTASYAENGLLHGESKAHYYWTAAFSHYEAVFKKWLQTRPLNDPNVCSTAFGLGRCLRELGQVDKAMQILSTVVSALEIPMEETTANGNSACGDENQRNQNPFQVSLPSVSFIPRSLRKSGTTLTAQTRFGKERLSALCLWTMATLSVESHRNERGRVRALSLLHAASEALEPVIQQNYSGGDAQRDDYIDACFEMLRFIEMEATALYQPLENANGLSHGATTQGDDAMTVSQRLKSAGAEDDAVPV